MDDFLEKLVQHFVDAGNPLSSDTISQIKSELKQKQIQIWQEEKEKARHILLKSIAKDLVKHQTDLSEVRHTITDISKRWSLDIDSIERDMAH